jgi:glutaredoxin 3
VVIVTAYVRAACPFCKHALRLLQELGHQPEIIDIKKEPQRRSEMIAKANGRTTVPQIFINGEHIGGCDDLFDLHRAGKLVPKLS